MHWKHICRTELAGRRDARDYPAANRFDEVDMLMVLDNVLTPGADSLCRHTRAASFIRATLRRYSTFETCAVRPAATANGSSGRRIFHLPSSAPLQ